jgi:pimeloyl-ACP methyl ester carboxylesterase
VAGSPTFRFLLVPGFWLGAWAWEAVAANLRGAGHEVTALTLPGLDRRSDDRSTVHMEHHIAAIAGALVADPEPAVLVLHSGAGLPGYAATDRAPGSVAAVVYVDTGPGTGSPMAEGFEGVDYPLPAWPDLVEDGNSIDGLDDETLATFRERAVPQPGNVLREGFPLSDDPARLRIPSTVVCTSMTVEQVKGWVAAGEPFVAELGNLTGPLEWVDLPTGHWPMWSRPADLSAELIRAAERAAGRSG